jgi:hypothetical protein
MKLDAVKFGLAMGIVYALVFFVLSLISALTGWGREWMQLIGSVYAGTGASLGGAVIGGIWGFGIGFVFFGAAAWIYNRLLDR